MKKKEYGITLSVLLIMALAVFSTFAIAGCGGGGTEATGDILYEASTASEEVVEDWAGALVAAGTQTGMTVAYSDAHDGVTFTFTAQTCGLVTTFLSGSTTQTITHGHGGTPTACYACANGGTMPFNTGTYTLTTFDLTRALADGAGLDRSVSWCCGD